jgi:hypothetical protein
MSEHIHVFDSEVYCLRYQAPTPRRGVYAPTASDGMIPPSRYSGAVELGCECGAVRTFTPSDGQPTKEFWGSDMGQPNPALPSQPPHLVWDSGKQGAVD